MKRQNDGVDVQGKAPAFFYYPQDVERDVQMLSLSAQGLWLRMLGWMHFCDRRGFLELPTGIPMNDIDIAARVGKPIKEVIKAISEMERIGLFSRDDRGCIFNRRMERDTHISSVRKQAAAARLLDAKRTEDGKFAPAKTDFAPPNSPQTAVLSSSSSFSSSPKGNTPPLPPQGDLGGGEMPKQALPGQVQLNPRTGPELDELWIQWRGKAGRVLTREIWSEEDFKHAYDEGWRRLDTPTRFDAVEKTNAETLTDSARKSTPLNFLQKRLFYRQISTVQPATNGVRGGITKHDLEGL